MELSATAGEGLHRVIGVIEQHEILSIAAVLVVFGVITTDWSLAGFIVMYGLFAVAYNFCLGRTGILTFGHAAFFGVGAYTYGLLVFHTSLTGYGTWLAVLASIGMAAVTGLAFGALVLRLRGTYLALVTLALAQALWFLAEVIRGVTGGDDGLIGVERPPVEIPGVFEMNLADPKMFFVFALVILVLSLLVTRYFGRSHFGHVLVAIRENENRARFLGYNTYRYKLAAFVISAAFSGIAGLLYPIFLGIVSPATLHWLLSGEVNFWVLIGGMNSLVGPIVGTGIYLFIREWFAASIPFWKIPVGMLIILMILYAPEGIIPRLRSGTKGK